MRRCSVDGCEKPAKARGYCQAHYCRWHQYGNPISGGTYLGEIVEWLDNVAIPYDGDECLSFPFARMKSGHGHIAARHGTSLAHVYVSLRVNGPKPDNHECCHSCGNGHLGCVTPKHLRWGTRAENIADRKRHGVFVPPPIHRGVKNRLAKLSDEKVLAIRRRLKAGEIGRHIAEDYGVTPYAIHAIKTGKTWRWLKETG